MLGGVNIHKPECEQEENGIYRHNRILEGIKRIFGSVVRAETEEALGKECLSLALKITGSQIGFVGEISPDGVMHDVAISEGGWEQCKIYDKAGHLCPPGDFALHGLYGKVINSRKSFFTNDPPSHPHSIGIPSGHPLIYNFLGVPLFLDGVIIGMIAVANREGNYSYEQQEDLETISPAVAQSLHWRKTEQERKKVEKELRESEERFRSLFEVISSGVAIYNVIDDGYDFIFKDINPAGEHINHVRREDIIGKSVYEIFSGVREMGIDAAFRRVWLTGKPELFPLALYKDKNTALWVVNYIYRLPSGELVAVFDDITEQKQAEEEKERLLGAIQQEKDKLAALINSTTDEIWFADTQKKFTLINPPVLYEFGISTKKQIAVEKLLDRLEVYRPDGSLRPIEESPALRALRGEIIKNEDETVRTPVHGELRHRQVSSAPVHDTAGNIIGSVSIARDITEQRKAKESLAKLEAARQKEIHHRIKNNLQVISSLLDLQAEKFNNREYINDLEVLEAFRECQGRVVSIALIHEELYEDEETDTLNFSLYLQRLAESLFQTYRLGNIDVSLNLDLETDIFFNMDTVVPLGIIVNELVSNSLKHAFKGRERGKIQIKLFSEKTGNEPNDKEETAGKKTGYTLIVSDNGAGIPEEIDFKNSDTLGMQLVTALIDQLDGEIELNGDKATEFRIRFNVQQS